jgi:aspartyl/asparaginyl beta-hydroxylase (cupin superfamily)
MFDDSKVHRAFNYSKDLSRTVLIIDIARPTNMYPLGTATGGHSNELDAFIEQFQ